jgi:uncharacterized protein (DUF1499 family)
MNTLIKTTLTVALSLFIVAPVTAAASSQLAPCPDSPNCTSTQAQDSSQKIDAPELAIDAATAWPAIIKAVEGLTRTVIVESSDHQLQAESTSLIFRFTDDLNLQLDLENNRLEMRSASRTGYSDMGVNRSRLEAIIETLKAQGVVK